MGKDARSHIATPPYAFRERTGEILHLNITVTIIIIATTMYDKGTRRGSKLDAIRAKPPEIGDI